MQYATLSLTGGAYGPVCLLVTIRRSADLVADTAFVQLISFSWTFLMGMLINPDAQRKAHAEMDAVVGRERLPTAADRPALPYLEAVLTEMLRWLPSATLGVSI